MKQNGHIDNDLLLLDGLRRGNRHAFECIFKKYYIDMVMFSSHFFARREDCEDVVQAMFMSLWEQRAQLPTNIANFKAYMLRSLQNACLNEINRLNIHRRYTAEFMALMSNIQHENGYTTLLYSELKALLESAESTLTPEEYETWHLSRTKGLKYAEIARQLGVAERTVEARIARVKYHFRKILDCFWSI